MLRRLFTVIMLIIFVGLVSAQDDFPEEFIFVDGTVVNFPSDFLVYDEDYDDMYMANASIDMRFFVVYERTIQSQELDSLPVILEWYFGDSDAYELGAEEVITIGEREGIRFSYKTDANIQRTLIVLPTGENGSVSVVTIQPNTDNVEDDTADETLPLQIISTAWFLSIRRGLRKVRLPRRLRPKLCRTPMAGAWQARKWTPFGPHDLGSAVFAAWL